MRILLSLLVLSFHLSGIAQMYDPAISADTLYGNEWIDYERDYLRVKVAEDGLYRIDPADLPAGSQGADLRLYHLGREVPLYVSDAGPIDPSSTIEFFGRRNRNEVDRFLWTEPAQQLNPEYSVITDSSAYYLSWTAAAGGAPLRYQTLDNELTNAGPPKAWVEHEERLNFHSHHTKYYVSSSGVKITYSHFDLGEGFASNIATPNPPMVFEPVSMHSSGEEVTLGLRFATNLGNHLMQVQVNGQTQLEADEPNGYQLLDYSFAYPYAAGDGPIDLTVSDLDPDNTNRQMIAEARIRYRHNYDLNGASTFRWTEPAHDQPLYLELTNADPSGGVPVVLDTQHGQRVVADVQGGTVRLVLPPSATDRRLLLTTDAVTLPGSVRQFTPVDHLEADYLILTHPYFLNDPSGVVAEYAAFRSQAYTVATVDVTDLYEQFSYGLDWHPLAVRNYISYLKANGGEATWLLLIGKARELHQLRTPAQRSANVGTSAFLPTFGFPGSDNLLVSYPGTVVPQVAVGRIVATEASQVAIYLDKIQQQEAALSLPQTIEDRAWLKRIIHLGGGGNIGEQNSIISGLRGMENAATDGNFAANVNSFFKSSTDDIQTSISAGIFDKINEGASMLTFFGHSSPGTFDFDIDNPESYRNQGKYPLMISLGCYSGDQFTSAQSVGERFVFYDQKGAVGFAASRGIGFITALSLYGQQLYGFLSGDLYGRTFGEIIKETNRRYSTNLGLEMRTLVEQFSLQGDPALRFAAPEAPDLVPAMERTQFEPNIVNSQDEDFEVIVPVVNLGKNTSDTFTVVLRRQLPNESEVRQYTARVSTDAFERMVRFTIPTEGSNALGLNKFWVEVDADNEVDEAPLPAAESNNRILPSRAVELFIIDNTTTAIYPPRYSIQNGTAPIVLKASVNNLFAPQRNYIFEIDTVGTFDSPALLRNTVTQAGGVLNWQPDLSYQPDRVYYWRVSPQPSVAVDYVWSASSFVYAPDEGTGWHQAHGDQFKELNVDLLNPLRDRKWAIGDELLEIRVKNGLRNNPSDKPEYFVNGNSIGSARAGWNVIGAGVTVHVIDTLIFTLLPNAAGGEHGSTNGTGGTIRAFSYPCNTPENRAALIDFLENVVSDRAFVWVSSVMVNANSDYNADEWAADSLTTGTNLFQVFEAAGIPRVRTLEESGNVPFIFLYRKGVGYIDSQIGLQASDIITLDADVPRRLKAGTVYSRDIGPATAWSEFAWDFGDYINPTEDSVSLSIFGLTAGGQLDSLYHLTHNDDPTLTLSDIDPTTYPYLRLRYHVSDPVTRTAPHLQSWTVRFTEAAELALNTQGGYRFEGDTLDQGQPLRLTLNVANIGRIGTDSTDCVITLTDANNQRIERTTRVAPLASGAATDVSFELPTRNLSGEQRLTLRLNPDKNPQELTYVNNAAGTNLTVLRDGVNPSLDVSFDGRRIMSGDIVAPNALVQITLRDENRYLLLSDTALFDVRLVAPSGTERRVRTTDEGVVFERGSSSNDNRARLYFPGQFEETGMYRLVVNARDESGNASGNQDVSIEFEVVQENTVSQVLNYPNPFSTSTRFVYTLTGEVPAFFQIQVMTVSGRLVRTLDQADLGELRVGTHQTDFAWDGTDQYGDPLANGVYLYRVVAKDAAGDNYKSFDEVRDLGLGQYFERGFGKMVLVR